MYYPFLRGKQFELILLRENAKLLKENNIHPIIEPVKEDFKALNRALKVLNNEGLECTLVVNPKSGNNPVNSEKIINDLFLDSIHDYSNVCIGYILKADSNISDLTGLLKEHNSFNFSIIHYGFTKGKELANAISSYSTIQRHIFIDGFAGKLYQRNFKTEDTHRILIRDGFKPQKKNSLYPRSEHFSDLHITYTDERMDGFGDFLIVGDDYRETGGPAYAVAIHLTYLAEENDMFIYHFISDQTDSPTDPGGKFLEALEKLIEEIDKPDSSIFKSKASEEYQALYEKQHFPGLGYVKKLSMQHHVELIADFLKRS